MFSRMLKFEWRYFVRQPSFYVTSMVFFLLPFLATISDNVRIGGGGNVLYNGSYTITQTMLILGIFGMFLVVNFIGNTAVRNDLTKMSEILYTKPMSPLWYQLGRFAGAYLVILTVFAMVPLGILLGTLMPTVDSERLGPINLYFYISTFVYFTVPTMFVLSCLFYAVALRFRSMMAVYLAAVALFIAYVVGGNFLDEPQLRTIAAMSDPFGLRTFADVSRYWTPIEKNTLIVEFSGVLLHNRLLWLGIGLVALIGFGRLNKPITEIERSAKSEKTAKLSDELIEGRIDIKGKQRNAWQKLRTRTLFEVKQVILSPSFFVLLAFSLFQLIALLVNRSGNYDTEAWPLTYEMVNLISGGFSLLMIIIVAYYSAEVVWRERSVGMGDIVDSMPVFSITFWASKLLAVCLVILLLLTFGMGITISYQLIMGYAYLDISQYVLGLFYFTGLPFMLMAVLAFFIQVLSPNKFVGMLIFVAYVLSELVFEQLGLEHSMLNFATAPILPYSDMNGYGELMLSHSWYMLYWSGLAVALSTLGYALWQRGPQNPLRARFKMLAYQLGRAGKMTLVASLTVFALSGSWIYYNTTVLNEFVSTEQELDRSANYEKAYAQYADTPTPKFVSISANVAIFPEQRRIEASADIEMLNASEQVISRVLVNKPQHTAQWSVSLGEGLLSEVDEELGTAWFEFVQPIQPGERRQGHMQVVRQHKGFKDRGHDPTLLNNGTFINNGELFPVFGVNQSVYLTDRHERRKRDLPPPRRAYPLEDSSRYGENYIDPNNDFIEFEATVSTSPEQIAIAPGYLQREWQEQGRRYFHYKMDSPMLNFYAFQSAVLAVKTEQHNGVNIEVYHHPAHHWNVDVMIQSVKDSLDYFSAEFGPYQHKQMRIIEFPRYRSFAQSFANTVPYSEDIGFTSDLRDPDSIDPVYYVTAHEVAHQWWAHQVVPANVQGGTVLAETLSQYSAIKVLANKYGKDKLRKFLTFELDNYLRGRSSESLEEMPLFKVENQAYIHYRKGSVVMMALEDKLGEKRLNKALKDFLTEFKFAHDPYPTTLDLLRHLKQVSTSEEQAFITRQFEQISIYDLKAQEVAVEMHEDGSHTITLTVMASLYSANGKGEESPMDLDEMIDIALFSAKPDALHAQNLVLYKQKHRIKSGENVISISIPELPEYAGVDPFVTLVDRDSANNIIRL